MPVPRFHPTHALALMLGAAIVAGGLGLEAARGAARVPAVSGASPAPLPDSLVVELEYAGVAAGGTDLIWRGHAGGGVSGQMTLRMEYAGAPADREMPVWPVTVRLLFSADDHRNGFAADLSGSMNWRSGVMRVVGVVVEGARAGSSLEQQTVLRRPRLAGVSILRFVPRLSLRMTSG